MATQGQGTAGNERVPTSVTLTDFSTKWGLVSVSNPDGTLNREYIITAAEAEAVRDGNNVLPPECTQAEWEAGLVVVTTRPCNVGQAVRNPDGALVVNYGVKRAAKAVDVSLMRLEPHEWEVTEGIVRVSTLVALKINVPSRAVTSIPITG